MILVELVSAMDHENNSHVLLHVETPVLVVLKLKLRHHDFVTHASEQDWTLDAGTVLIGVSVRQTPVFSKTWASPTKMNLVR